MTDFAIIPQATDADFAEMAANRVPSTGEYLGAKITDALANNTAFLPIRAGIATLPYMDGNLSTGLLDKRDPITEQDYKESLYYRPQVPFEAGMTLARAHGLADIYDANQYRRHIIDRTPNNPLVIAAGFGASMVGGLPDPVNFVPIVGPEMRAAMLARYGVIGGHAAVSAIDAAAGNVAALPIQERFGQQWGDDMSFADASLNVAAGAAIGTLFGVGAGALHARSLKAATEDVRAATAQMTALNEAVMATVAGEPVQLSEASRAEIRQAIEPIAGVHAQDIAALRQSLGLETPGETIARIADIAPELRNPIEQVGTNVPVVLPDFVRTLARLRGMETEQPLSLSGFIADKGGVRTETKAGSPLPDMAGLRSVGAEHMAAGKEGVALEELAQQAYEAGYFPGRKEAPTVNEFLDTLKQEQQGAAIYRESDQPLLTQQMQDNALRYQMEQHGIDLGQTDSVIKAQLDNLSRAANSPFAVADTAGRIDISHIPADFRGKLALPEKVHPAQLAEAIAKAADAYAKPGVPRFGDSRWVVPNDEPLTLPKSSSGEYGVNIETGKSDADAQYDALVSLGRISEEDKVAVAEADKLVATANQYAEAYKAAAQCFLGNG